MFSRSTARSRRGRQRQPSPPPAQHPQRTLRPLRGRAATSLADFYELTSSTSSSPYSSESESGADEPQIRSRRKVRLVVKLSQLPPVRRSSSPSSRQQKMPARGRKKSSVSMDLSEASSYVEDDEDDVSDGDEVNHGEDDDGKPPKTSTELRCGCPGSRLSKKDNDLTQRIHRSNRSATRRVLSPVLKTPLPDWKMLEEILDKLQKKDTYGVFAQPVDPEELPDYHSVIDHPMDFGTVRNKLVKNVYRSLEQFEDDVFLICSNAMQYNAPETIYFRQARSIQEMALQKFQNLRFNGMSSRNKVKNEEDGPTKKLPPWPTSEEPFKKVITESAVPDTLKRPAVNSSLTEAPAKKSVFRDIQETMRSDISSSETLASTVEPLTMTAYPGKAVTPNQPSNLVCALPDNSSSLGESKSDKQDELSARDSPSEPDNDAGTVDEHKRYTYGSTEEQTSTNGESIFDAIQDEPMQLSLVGFDCEYQYAKSLSLFSASLGPAVWTIASRRIGKTLPAGIQYGPGWVGEYEPVRKNPDFLSRTHYQPVQRELGGSVSQKSAATRQQLGGDMALQVNGQIAKIEHLNVTAAQTFPVDGKARQSTVPASAESKGCLNSCIFLPETSTKSASVSNQLPAKSAGVKSSFFAKDNRKQSSTKGSERNRYELPLEKQVKTPVNLDLRVPSSEDLFKKSGSSKSDHQPEAKRNGARSHNSARAVGSPAMFFPQIQAPPSAGTNGSSSRNWIPFGMTSSETLETKPQISTPSNSWMLPNHGNLQVSHLLVPSQQPLPFAKQLPVEDLVIFPQLLTVDLPSQNSQKLRKDMTMTPDLNIGFPSPRSPPSRPSSGLNLESQQPDLALQL